MTCKNCKNHIEESDNYCANCGFNIKANQLPVLAPTALSPKEQQTYDNALTRLEKRITVSVTNEQEGRYLFFTGLALSGFWAFNQLVAYTIPGGFLTNIYAVLITLEAALPLALSFFVQANVHKKALRIIGSALFLFFVYQHFL
ncbi:MAG: hypothetical protein GY810_15050 [Aureispira sp.]|nr:hypothetical protein [Aureispira sp.]